MELTWPIALAVLVGALLHASWNALIKSRGERSTILMKLLGALIALPLILWLGLPPRTAWPYFGFSLILHVGYYFALVAAYRNGDLSLTYPIMRGFAPLLVALASGAVIGEPLSILEWLGILAIAAGVSLVGLAPRRLHLQQKAALAFAFVNAAIIAVYTVVDGLAVRIAESADGKGALRYVLLLFLVDGLAYVAIMLMRSGTTERTSMVQYARKNWPAAAVGACAAIVSYTIGLWAMTRAPIASVAALRETSVLFAALLGVLMLKERFGPKRAVGTVVIVAGIMALRFA